MEKHICHVMMTRIHPINLAIQHMRKPCQWVPVARMCSGERPPYAFKCQSSLYIVVSGNILADHQN